VVVREWWSKYLRGAASFRGVKMEDIRTAVHAWFEEEQLGEYLSVGQQKDLALMLLEEDHTEDKIAGVLFLQEILLPEGALDWRSELPRFARLFDDGYISDWSICDWLCVKVLGPLVGQRTSHLRVAGGRQPLAASRLRRGVRQSGQEG
jgi:3-methyladenine DNA glycosylase AlkD